MPGDGTEQMQDTSVAKQDSSVEATGTQTAETPTFTKAMLDKAVSDALSKAGRSAKSLGEMEQKLNSGMAELVAQRATWQKEREEAEEAAIADDMPALTALRERRRKKAEEETKTAELTDREAKLAQREAELAEIVERDRILTRTQLAAEVAVEKGVSIDAILKLAKEDTREAYEVVAEVLPKTKEPPVLVSDSGRNNRGGIDLDNMSPKEKIEMGLEKLRKK